jgi:hypothetical protein
MTHELVPHLTESASSSHPCRVVSVTYDQLRPFHGGSTGSNPVGEAKSITDWKNVYSLFEKRVKNREFRT